jgi:hypothetical protein
MIMVGWDPCSLNSARIKLAKTWPPRIATDHDEAKLLLHASAGRSITNLMGRLSLTPRHASTTTGAAQRQKTELGQIVRQPQVACGVCVVRVVQAGEVVSSWYAAAVPIRVSI